MSKKRGSPRAGVPAESGLRPSAVVWSTFCKKSKNWLPKNWLPKNWLPKNWAFSAIPIYWECNGVLGYSDLLGLGVLGYSDLLGLGVLGYSDLLGLGVPKETIRGDYSKETIRRSGAHDIFWSGT